MNNSTGRLDCKQSSSHCFEIIPCSFWTLPSAAGRRPVLNPLPLRAADWTRASSFVTRTEGSCFHPSPGPRRPLGGQDQIQESSICLVNPRPSTAGRSSRSRLEGRPSRRGDSPAAARSRTLTTNSVRIRALAGKALFTSGSRGGQPTGWRRGSSGGGAGQLLAHRDILFRSSEDDETRSRTLDGAARTVAT